MAGMIEGLGAIMKLIDDPNFASASLNIGKAAQELPADVREIRDTLYSMLVEFRKMDETLNRLIPKHQHNTGNWPHEQFKPEIAHEEMLEQIYGKDPNAG